jgi:hypothetical protein
MVFFKYKSICVGIPKTATSSLFETWKNGIDVDHNHSTLLQDYEQYGYDKIKDFYTFTIIRNPYDRFVSMAHQYFRDENNDPTTDCNVVASYLIGKDLGEIRNLNEMFLPHYYFVCDENQNLIVENHWLFDRIESTYRAHASDFNQKTQEGVFMPETMAFENVSRERIGKKWEDEINDDTIRIINDVYYNDFEIFKFKKIIV